MRKGIVQGQTTQQEQRQRARDIVRQQPGEHGPTHQLRRAPVVAEKLVVVEAPDTVGAGGLQPVFRLQPAHRVEVPGVGNV